MNLKVTLFLRNQPTRFSIENVVKNIASHLPETIDVHIYKPSVDSKGFFKRLKIAVEARLQQGDVNHITGDIHFIAMSMSPKKTIITMHDCERLMSNDYGRIKKMVYKYLWFTLPAKYASKITTISEESKRNLMRYAGIPSKQIEVIPIGVDDSFMTLNINEHDKAVILNNRSNKPAVLHISDAKTNKNVERLIEALDGLNVKFIKIGRMTDSQMTLLKKHNIDFYHVQNASMDTLVKIYNSVDCLAFPSLVEGFGMPVLEAQRCGCPVITSNTSSLPEVAGNGAVLVDPYSAQDIRRGILEVLQDHAVRDAIVARGFANAQRFEWSRIASMYENLYSRVHLNECS